MMGVFRHRESAGWHRSIKATAADKHPITIITIGQAPQPNPSFPWDKLQEHTDAYLRKKKKLTPEQLEARLVEFIKQHADKMDIAIAACGHKLKPETLRALLISDLNVGPGKNLRMSSYLQAIIAANRVNPQSVGDAEAQRAHSMIAAATIGAISPGNYLHELFKILIDGIPPTFLLYTHIHALALKACTDFATQLQRLKDDGHLRQAYFAASWLSNISERSLQLAPGNLGPEQLLDTAFPRWKNWATWKPNQERLFQWERFTNEERISLSGLLALEGPDSVGREATLREGILAGGTSLSSSPVHVGSLILEPRLSVDLKQTVDRLMMSIDAASVAGPNDVALLIYKCAEKTITHDALTMLELARSTGDSSITALLLPVYGANKEPRSVQMTAAMRLLPLISHDQCQRLRELLTPHLVTLINNSLKDIQTSLQTQLESGNTLDDTEIKLQGFGSGLLLSPWILPLLDQNFRTLLTDWPTKDDIVSLHKLRISAQAHLTPLRDPLIKNINDFCMDCLIKRGTIDKPAKRLIEALISVWDEPPSADLHSVALFVAQGPGFENKLRCRCLSLLSTLPAPFLSKLRLIMQIWEKDPDTACVDLAQLLAPIPPSAADAAAYWRLVLYSMIDSRGHKLVANQLSHMRPEQWIKFLSDLRAACGHIEPRDPPPAIMEPALQAWGQRIEKHSATLTGLDKDLVRLGPVMQCLLMGAEGDLADHLDNILKYFTTIAQDSNSAYRKPVMLAVIKLLTRENITTTAKVLSTLLASSNEGVDACMRVLDLHHGKTTKLVAEAMLASWLQPSNMGQLDQSSLKALADMLGMNIGPNNSTKIASLEAAADYLDAQFAKLFAEAKRLEGLRASFKREDPKGISKLLSHLNIEDPSPVEDFLAKLPRSLVGVVEMVSDEEVEMQFPLKLTPLQQIAMGVGNARSLILRLFITDYPKPPGFCIHLDNEKKTGASTKGHTPWDPSKNKLIPDQHPCFGRPNRTAYQLTRILTRHLHSGLKSLEEIHKLITTALKDLTTTCLICGTPKATQLRRSAACQPACSAVFLRSSLEVRLAEIRHDPPVMDLLLTMVHYAAASRKLELLPGCPFPDTLAVATALNKIPSISKLTNVDDLTSAVKKLGIPTEKLLSWTCLNYRGFLVSASGKTKIPGWPANTHQFLMASAAPNLEAVFRAQIGSLPTRVLWHGTSMERLFAIISQGLKVCSNTPLQVHGAASGPGIYTADNPGTSWGYSTVAGANWSGSSFLNYRVLLGLEAAGPAVGTGIHVVKDPSTLMVRYVFLVPTGATIPAATIVAPAMQSVYNSLRAGAV
jgi:hypothetical protein